MAGVVGLVDGLGGGFGGGGLVGLDWWMWVLCRCCLLLPLPLLLLACAVVDVEVVSVAGLEVRGWRCWWTLCWMLWCGQVADPWTWEDGGLAVGTIIIPKLGLQPKPFGEA